MSQWRSLLILPILVSTLEQKNNSLFLLVDSTLVVRYEPSPPNAGVYVICIFLYGRLHSLPDLLFM